jgi:hypothetical protein
MRERTSPADLSFVEVGVVCRVRVSIVQHNGRICEKSLVRFYRHFHLQHMPLRVGPEDGYRLGTRTVRDGEPAECKTMDQLRYLARC